MMGRLLGVILIGIWVSTAPVCSGHMVQTGLPDTGTDTGAAVDADADADADIDGEVIPPNDADHDMEEPTDSSADTDCSDSDTTTDSDNDATEADVASYPEPCDSNADCDFPEPYCMTSSGICYDGVLVRCQDDSDCPEGWGLCGDGGVCSG
jgi:hypothetical protein